MISALDKYCSQHKTAKIAVISRDEGFKDASVSRPQFVYFESLSVYLEKSIAEQTTIQRIHKLLQERDGAFRGGIEQEFERLEFIAGQAWEDCVVTPEGISTTISKQSIIELKETKFTVAVEGVVSFKAHVEIAEYSPAARQYYDPQKHDSWDYVNFRATVKMKADAEFNVKCFARGRDQNDLKRIRAEIGIFFLSRYYHPLGPESEPNRRCRRASQVLNKQVVPAPASHRVLGAERGRPYSKIVFV